ncbi:MAG: hypothetical protein SXA11_25565 [Cyanobacteriota bacterium]|nr:hypothetical protein [Cyanobacteriota bacterium]
MSNYNKNKDLERLLELAQEINKVVARILEKSQEKMATTNKANTVLIDISRITELEVKQKTGINLWNDSQQLKLEGLLESAPSLIVQRAIGKYVRHYGPGGGDYPAALFCKVLENELLQDFDKAI